MISYLTRKLLGDPERTPFETALADDQLSHLFDFPPSVHRCEPTRDPPTMAQFFQNQQQPPYNPNPSAQNLQFYPSSYTPGTVSGHATPSQAAYGYGASPAFGGAGGYGGNFGAAPSVSGRMGEQGGLRTGWLAAFGTEGYPGEPPLLEELGVNFGHIKSKTLAVLNPFAHIDQHIMDDSDLAGPILFFFLFGTFLLFSGKVHFGYIYGLMLIGSLGIHSCFSLMSPAPDPRDTHNPHPPSTLTFPRSLSVLGYCLLPLVATSVVGIVLPMDAMLGYVLTSMAIVWCTFSSSAMFCAVGRMTHMRGLVAYPLALFYGAFGIMGIFSAGGGKVLVGKAGKGL